MQVFERDFIYKIIPQLTDAVGKLADAVNKPEFIELHNRAGSVFISKKDIISVYANNNGCSLVTLSNGGHFDDIVEETDEIMALLSGGKKNGKKSSQARDN